MGYAAREARKVAEQKRKYWLKTQSETAIDVMLDRMFDIYDYFAFWGDWILSDTLFSSLVSLVFFDLAIPDLTPWTLTWEVELPTLDEFLAGVLIKLEPIDITIEFPELKLPDLTLDFILEPDFSFNIKETRPKKLKVGVTKYGEGYVDPPAVREFLRSTALAILKKDISIPAARNMLKAAAKAWNITEAVVEELFNRLSAITAIKEKALTWDYGWWDRSNWSAEGSSGKVTFTNYQGEEVEAEYEHLADFQWGGHWDLSSWDYFFWTTHESPYKTPPPGENPNISKIRDYVVHNFRDRIHVTPFAVANYQKAEARTAWNKSPRTETYGMPLSQRYRLESLVDNMIRQLKPDVGVFQLRLYKSAILDLYGTLYDPHRWGAEAQRVSSKEELKTYWLEKWKAHGLDESILTRLFEALYDTITAYGIERAKMRLRFLRYRMRLGR